MVRKLVSVPFLFHFFSCSSCTLSSSSSSSFSASASAAYCCSSRVRETHRNRAGWWRTFALLPASASSASGGSPRTSVRFFWGCGGFVYCFPVLSILFFTTFFCFLVIFNLFTLMTICYTILCFLCFVFFCIIFFLFSLK